LGNGTEDLQQMHEEFEEENEGITITAQVLLLVNPRTIQERRQHGETTTS